ANRAAGAPIAKITKTADHHRRARRFILPSVDTA
ncbi:MAG: hypothetical protein JWO31_471, partial [Phycisphaerales bacterium]|nr:hypothetical protein [Phycisphaerales bacterium]